MKYALLYHLNAYTYADPNWFPDMDPELRAMFQNVTKGSLSGRAGEKAKEDWKVNGEYVDPPDKGVVGIPFLDDYVEKAGIGPSGQGVRKGRWSQDRPGGGRDRCLRPRRDLDRGHRVTAAGHRRAPVGRRRSIASRAP
jgi:hypothetical protein